MQKQRQNRFINAVFCTRLREKFTSQCRSRQHYRRCARRLCPARGSDGPESCSENRPRNRATTWLMVGRRTWRTDPESSSKHSLISERSSITSAHGHGHQATSQEQPQKTEAGGLACRLHRCLEQCVCSKCSDGTCTAQASAAMADSVSDAPAPGCCCMLSSSATRSSNSLQRSNACLVRKYKKLQAQLDNLQATHKHKRERRSGVRRCK